MTKFSAALLTAAVLMAPAAAQAGTAIDGHGVGAAFGANGGDKPTEPFGTPLDMAGAPRYTLATPATLAAGQDFAAAVSATTGADPSVLAVVDLAAATGGNATGTTDADVGAHLSLPDLTSAVSGVALNGKFSFRAIALRLPEPATWGLMILGFGAIGGAMRFHIRRSEARFTAKLRRIAAGETA